MGWKLAADAPGYLYSAGCCHLLTHLGQDGSPFRSSMAVVRRRRDDGLGVSFGDSWGEIWNSGITLGRSRRGLGDGCGPRSHLIESTHHWELGLIGYPLSLISGSFIYRTFGVGKFTSAFYMTTKLTTRSADTRLESAGSLRDDEAERPQSMARVIVLRCDRIFWKRNSRLFQTRRICRCVDLLSPIRIPEPSTFNLPMIDPPKWFVPLSMLPVQWECSWKLGTKSTMGALGLRSELNFCG